MATNMAAAPPIAPLPPAIRARQMIDRIWVAAITQLETGYKNVVMPANLPMAIGDIGVDELVGRLSDYLKAPCSKAFDLSRNVMFIGPPTGYFNTEGNNGFFEPDSTSASEAPPSEPLATASNGTHLVSSAMIPQTEFVSATGQADAFAPAGNDTHLASSAMVPQTKSVSASDQAAPASMGPSTVTASTTSTKLARKRTAVPRPANSFILYRKAHHDVMAAAHPHLHNNQLSQLIGNMWRNEQQTVKDAFKAQADAAAAQHRQAYPNYQYRPRKPEEKKKRATKKKAVSVTLPSSTVLSDEPLFFVKPTVATPTIEQTCNYELEAESYLGYDHHPTEDGSKLFEQALDSHNPAFSGLQDPLITLASSAAEDHAAYASVFDSADLQRQAEEYQAAQANYLDGIVQTMDLQDFTSFTAETARQETLANGHLMDGLFDFNLPLGHYNVDTEGHELDLGN